MPNGGTDCCGFCIFISLNREKGQFDQEQWDYLKKNPQEIERLSYCTIRNVTILDPFWIYCVNNLTRNKVPEGPIYRMGLVPYERIPWHGNNEPKVFVPGQCFICGKSFERGIEIELDKCEIRQFCSNEHYIDWWKENHPNEKLAYSLG